MGVGGELILNANNQQLENNIVFTQFRLTYIHQWGGLFQLYPGDILEEKPWGSQPVRHLFQINKRLEGKSVKVTKIQN